MKIQVNADSNIEGREKITVHITSVVERAHTRFGDQITSSESPPQATGTVKGRRPTGVTHHAATLGQAVDGAADRLRRSLESTMERLRNHG